MSEEKESERENISKGEVAERGSSSKRVTSFRENEFGSPASSPIRHYLSELITPDRFEPNTVFTIMSFMGEGMNEVYSVIKDECSKLGLRTIRVDETFGSGFIIKDILEGIEQAEFIICDLTHVRPNVYYELGYAHGVGNHSLNILLIAKEGTQLHFDIAPLRVKYYQTP